MHTINNLLSSPLFLSKMDIPALKKRFKKIAEDFLYIFIIPNKPNTKINFSINNINIAIILAILRQDYPQSQY